MVRVKILSLALVVAMTISAVSSAQTEPKYSEDVVAASTLKRAFAVTPTWPQAAKGVGGWVMLRFTVLPNGTVTDVEVKESSPAGIFDDSAVEALRQWKYEPVERDGKKIAQRAEIRMTYALPK